MSEFSSRMRGPCRVAIAAALVMIAGCSGGTALENAGISGLSPAATWSPVEPSRFLVPGRALAAWSGPNGSSLVVFGSLPAPRVTADGLLRESQVRLENLPELQIRKASKMKIGDVEAASLEIVAPGTGDALAPTGLGKPIAPEGKILIPTRRISLGIPGRSRTIWLVWHAPESSAAALEAEVKSAVADMKIRDRAPSSY